MPEMQDETGAATQPPLPVEEQQTDDDGKDLARYELAVPLTDNKGRNIPHVLGALRKALSDSGLHGRTIIPEAHGDWQEGEDNNFKTEQMAIVMIDAPDDPETLESIKKAAQGVKEVAGSSNIYLTVRPIKGYLV